MNNPNTLALSAALACSIPRLRSTAVSHIRKAYRAEGTVRATCARLGCGLATWQRWRELAPEITG